MKKWAFICWGFLVLIILGIQWGEAGNHTAGRIVHSRKKDAKKNFVGTISQEEETRGLVRNEGDAGREGWALSTLPKPKLFYIKRDSYNNWGFDAACGNVTRDGGFIFSGNMTMRVSSDGKIKWQNSNFGSSIQETRDRGFILCNNCYVKKLNANGRIQWQRKYLDSPTNNDRWVGLGSIQQTKDGGFIAITGNAGVLKLTASGKIVWRYSFSPDANFPSFHDSWGDGPIISSMMQTADGGYIIAGFTSNFAQWNYWGVFISGYTWIVKISADGHYEWDRTYVDDKYRFNSPQLVQQTKDGGYIVLASMDMGRDDTFGSRDLWVLKLFPNGRINWQKLFRVDLDLAGNSVSQMSDGGYIIAATESEGVISDDGQTAWSAPVSAVLLRLDARGNLEWQRSYGYQDHTPISCGSFLIKQRSDGSYIFAGKAQCIIGDGALIMKLNSEGLNETVPELAADAKVHSVSDVSFLLLQRGFTIRKAKIFDKRSYFRSEKTDAKENLLFSPPLHLTGELVKNSPLSKTGYLVNLRWEPNPNTKDMKIAKYRIHGNVAAEVDADTFEYTHLDINRFWLSYWVTAVTENGDESLLAYTRLN